MNARLLACAALLGTACVNTPAETSTTSADASAVQSPDANASGVVPASTAMRTKPSIALEARPHAAFMREVALSPDGEAALSLDHSGAVRLWTSFEAGALPFELPVEEPLWMSVAVTESGYLAAFIDTSGGAHVGRISIAKGKAIWTTAFDVPPMDPMFELHVLEGGQRILALGVDHRVRLWNAEGETLAELDEHGVIPWQLRVEHDEAGVHAAVVQFSPVRIQQLEVADDGLKLMGEAHTVAIDQSPNRNDIGMSSDGRYATAMQKRNSKSGRFELEIIDLHDGSRRMLAADSDTRFRPRVHPLADAVVVETGSGAGMRLPLTAAVPWNPEMNRDAISPVQPEMLTFAASDENSMVHTTVRGGKRAVAWDGSLHVQTTHGVSKQEAKPERFYPTTVGLNHDGGMVGWASASRVVFESLGSEGTTQTIEGPGEEPKLLAFVGDAHFVVLDAKGKVSLRERDGGAVVDTASVPVGWGISQTGWRVGPSGGSLMASDDRPGGDLSVLLVEDGKLGEPTTIPLRERADWPEGGKPRGSESADWMKVQGLDFGMPGLRPIEVVATLPQPGHAGNVVVQHHRSVSWEAHLTMVDGNERRWVHQTAGLHDAAWSADGSRFAYTDGSGGFVLDGRTGAVIRERRWVPTATMKE